MSDANPKRGNTSRRDLLIAGLVASVVAVYAGELYGGMGVLGGVLLGWAIKRPYHWATKTCKVKVYDDET